MYNDVWWKKSVSLKHAIIWIACHALVTFIDRYPLSMKPIWNSNWNKYENDNNVKHMIELRAMNRKF